MSDRESRPGPEPERLKLEEDDWQEAVRKALKGKKPEDESAENDEEHAKDGSSHADSRDG